MSPLASLSLDLDNLWSYQRTHGDPGWEAFPSYLDVVVPRVLSLLDELDLTITFFVVGQDAALPVNADAMAWLGRSRHEIGNHSFRHEPWLHRYSEAELHDELARAEDALEAATGRRTAAFRGPGYSLSETVLRVLHARDYAYDASTLPTVIGPLARAVYFRSARLTSEQREERAHLFGSVRDGFRPLKPYAWTVEGGSALVELPVTVLPVLRVPMHVSYLLTLAGVSPALATGYFRSAVRLCRLRGVSPSLLLHPLDFLGADDVDSLRFFPGMSLPGGRKVELVRGWLAELARTHRVVPTGEHAAAAGARPLRRHDPASATPRARRAA